MPKPYLIVMCSPDRDRFTTRRAIGSIKATDLSLAEFWLIDNNYDENFRHPSIMNRALETAARRGQSVIFLDDDIEITTFDWINRLEKAAQATGADILSCRHVWENGETNHEGYWIDESGLVAPIIGAAHRFSPNHSAAAFVPSLCSALMAVKDPARYYFDTGYLKYQQDLDICIQSWQRSKPVVCLLDLKIIHHAGSTGELHESFVQRLQSDSIYFAKKWQAILPTLYQRPELEHLSNYSPGSHHWRHTYQKASLSKSTDPELASALFASIAENCFDETMRSGANYHLYTLNQDRTRLEECLDLNPCHRAARNILAQASESSPARHKSCTHGFDCSRCLLGGK
jgi:hypothetical protein